MISDAYRALIINKLAPYEPVMIGIFGSYARNENTSESDLDILVEFENTVNLLDIIGLEIELSELLGLKVDLITKKSVHPHLEQFIKRDLQRIL